MSHLKLVRLPNHWIVMKISSAECEGEPPAEHKIKVMAEIMSPSSEYGKNPQPTKDTLRSKRLRICDHRDGDNGDDVTLYYPGFQGFIDQCNDTTLMPTREECTLTQHMCTYMSKYMPKGRTQEKKGKTTTIQPETIRQDIFIKLMNQFLKNPIETNDDEVKQFYKINGTQLFPNGTRLFPNGMMKKGGGYSLDGYIDPCTCVILEVKNESGQGGGSDSYAQAIAYYVKTLKEKLVRKHSPAFLLELVGPHLFISGAVYDKYVFVDRLVDPVWLVPQRNEDAIIRIARIFKALKEAIEEIRQYYDDKSSEDDDNTLSKEGDDTLPEDDDNKSSEEGDDKSSEEDDDKSSEEDDDKSSEEDDDKSSEDDDDKSSEDDDDKSSEDDDDKSSEDISLNHNGFTRGKISSESICGKVQGTTSKECNQDSAKSVKSWLKTILTNTLFTLHV